MALDIKIPNTFEGYIINGIEAFNNGDLCNLMVTKDILESKETTSTPTLVDIGADKGAWALMALSFSRNARILCFEPNSETYASSCLLQKEFPGLQWYHSAISDSSGTLLLSKDTSQSNSRPETLALQENLVNVQKYPLHHFLQNTDRVTLVKIDTEGHDLVILQNLLPLVQEKRIESIISEFSIYWYGNSPRDCIQKSKEVLYQYLQHYPHFYCLARTFPIFLLKVTEETLEEFCIHHYYNHLQTDICFTNHTFTGIKVYPFTTDLAAV